MFTRQASLKSIVVTGTCLVLTSSALSLSAGPAPLPQSAAPPTRAADGATQDAAVMSRRFVVGTSNNVRELMKENPQGYQFRRAANDVRVDERPAPGSCGVPLAKYFRDQIVSTFRIATANDCRISAEKVVCQSNLLPGYSQTYLSLGYTWRQTEVDLELAIRQSSLWGAVKNPQLGGNHVEWMESVFDCLVSIAECGSALPQCAVKR
jgi:hypothetical protein